MSGTVLFEKRSDDVTWGVLLGLLLVSAGAHLGVLYGLPIVAVRHEAPQHRIDLEIVELPKPKPPEPPKEPEKPKVEPPKPKPKLVVKVDTPKPPPPAPPPPNEPPPEPPKAPVPVVIGISLSNTAATGGFAAPVGNTVYGKVDEKAVDPNSVKAYAAPKYAPPGGADAEPSVQYEFRSTYPEEARKNGIEGSVRLRVTIDEKGNVTECTIVAGPGYGLNEAARDALKKFRFSPATQKGEPVRYQFVYTYTFLLD